MENWGLITGRTSAFLLDPQKVDIGAKKQIASTQSHEVAHMWFGNITTMAWWDYLYLNEGFASLVCNLRVLLIAILSDCADIDSDGRGYHPEQSLPRVQSERDFHLFPLEPRILFGRQALVASYRGGMP